MAATPDLCRLTTFQHHIDDMRNQIMCKICLKPLYEPYILACGHTYCYGCLRSWFSGLDSRKRKKNCPDCRADVKLTPSPNYILRDLVHMFISRTELLPEDETVDEHVAGKIAEAELLTNDKDSEGLFQGVFKTRAHPLAELGPLHDIADGVLRCPHCHWEIEDGSCEQCGYEIEGDDDYPNFSDEDDEDSMLDSGDSIVSDGMSDAREREIMRGASPHFYRRHPALEDIDQSVASEDTYSELEYGTPNHYRYDDEEDMDGFIDDHDETDEVDEDDMDGPVLAYIPRSRMTNHRIVTEEDDEESTQDDDELGVHRPYQWHPNVTIQPGHFSEIEDDGSSEEGANDNEDQETNYDESDNESRSATPVPAPTSRRRRPLVISDDEDENGSDNGSDNGSRTERGSQQEDQEASGDVQSDSDNATTPPRPSAQRRQRLDIRRKRRQTPDSNNWRTVARGRDQPVGRRDSRASRSYVSVSS